MLSAGCALTYITIDKELWMVAATYGFVSAFGQNIALIPTLTTGMKWFPDRKGKLTITNWIHTEISWSLQIDLYYLCYLTD